MFNVSDKYKQQITTFAQYIGSCSFLGAVWLPGLQKTLQPRRVIVISSHLFMTPIPEFLFPVAYCPYIASVLIKNLTFAQMSSVYCFVVLSVILMNIVAL